VASAQSVLDGLVYIAVFGCGSILGMMLIGLALSVPVVCSFRLGRPLFFAVQWVASVGSVALGAWIVYQVLLGDSLS